MTKARIALLAGLLILVALVGCRSAHTTSAILYIDEQKYDKAVQVIHEGFQYSADEPDAYYYLGEAYSHLGEEAVEQDDYPEAMKNLELAYAAYTRCLELDRKDWEEEVGNSMKYNYSNRLRQAQLDLRDKYYEQAEGHLRLAYASLPDSLTPIKSIARMKMEMSQSDEYRDQSEELLEEALSLLDQVLAAKPEAYGLRVDKANVLTALNRNDEARAIYDELLREHGDDTSLLMDIAQLATSDGDYARAADFYVQVVDLHEADTDPGNDDQNKEMLLIAGASYSISSIGRYEDALAVLDRAANLEMVPTENTMLERLKTYYKYGKHLKSEAAEEADPDAKAALQARADEVMGRAVEIGVAMTNNFFDNADGFLFLSMAQLEMGDFAAFEANNKTYEELSGSGGQ